MYGPYNVNALYYHSNDNHISKQSSENKVRLETSQEYKLFPEVSKDIWQPIECRNIQNNSYQNKEDLFSSRTCIRKKCRTLSNSSVCFFFLNLNICHKKLKKLQEETCAGMKDNTMKPMCLPSLPVSNIYFLTYYQPNVKTILLKNLLILKFL